MNGLLVPVDVMAYCIGTLDAQGPARFFAGAGADFTNQVTSDRPAFLGINVTRDADQPPLWPLEKGVHLHWAMPDALTHSPEGSVLAFPPLPNRWLVSRIVPKGLRSRHWIIESDHLSLQAQASRQPSVSTNDATLPDGEQRGFRYLGAWTLFDGSWREPTIQNGQSIKNLTGAELHAVTTGDIAFAAFYPNARGVVGFHDDLEDITDSPSELMYVITGWYADKANDPLAGGLSLPELQARLNWTFEGTPQAKPEWTLCHGLVQGIEWSPETRYVDDEPKPLTADVAVGNSPAEALAAYLRGVAHPHLAAFEELATLLVSGLLPSLASPGTSQLAKLEEILHGLEFTGTDGGGIYTLTRDNAQAASLPPALADALNKLNTARQTKDAAATELRQSQWQLFSDWLCLFEADSDHTTQALSAFDYQYTLFSTAKDNLSAATAALTQAQGKVQAILPDGLALTETPAPHYQTPNEPVVLLAGEAAAPAWRYGGDGRFHPSGYLVCRLDTNLLTALSIGQYTLKAATYAGLAPASPNHLPRPAIAALVQEAALLNTAIGASVSGQEETTLAADLNSWLEKGDGDIYHLPEGQPPSPVGVGGWPGANPWCSLMLLWHADFHPLFNTSDGDYPECFFTANYTLDPDQPRAIAYTPTKDGISVDPARINFDPTNAGSGTVEYSGTSVLSTTAPDNLRKLLDRELAKAPDPTLEALAKLLNQTDVSMQGLSGFNNALLSRRASLQLAVGVSPSAPLPFRLDTQKMLQAVPSLNQIAALAPLLNGSYSGVRAGYMNLSLQVMDPFGRKRPVQITSTYIAEGLTALSEGAAVPGVAYLQPRLSQPSRLLWRWLAADTSEWEEMNSHPATTPICGWLLPSHLDVGFFVYDASGTPLGTVSLRADGHGVMWQSAPGNQSTVDEPCNKVMQHSNPHLREVVLSLAKATPSWFRAFWQAADAAFAQITPGADQSQTALGLLVGRPLALVQSALRLERQGFPETDQTYAGRFDHTDRGLGGIKFPVILGDLKRLDDGLIGYFKAAESGGYDTSNFFSEAATGTDQGVVKPSTDTLLLTPEAASPDKPGTPLPDTKLLMLIDPRTEVHATMGILPIQSLAIPPDQYQNVLAGLELTTSIFPLLRPAAGPTPPFPKVAGFSQSWVEEVRSEGTSQWVLDPGLQAPATDALWQYCPQTLTEGWMRLDPELLRFRLADATGAPVVQAGSTAGLNLTLTNTLPSAITFQPGQTVAEGEPASGSRIYIHFGRLVDAALVPKIRFSVPGWTFTFLSDKRFGSYWCASPTTGPIVLPAGGTLTGKISGIAISQKTGSLARIYFDCQDVEGLNDCVEESILTVTPGGS